MNEPDAGGACVGLKTFWGTQMHTPFATTSQAAGDPPSPFESLRDLVALGGARVILIDSPLAFSTYSAKGEGRTPPTPSPVLVVRQACRAADRQHHREGRLDVPLGPAALGRSGEAAVRSVGLQVLRQRTRVGQNEQEEARLFHGGWLPTRKNVEISWLGRRGKPKRLSTSLRELIIAPRREHSRKPDEQYQRIEQFCAGPYVELFARTRRAGWHQWGDELGCFV